ncbi:MAG: hypothetical protein CMJ18_28015 [Phycisphaeraceae bacterium]|nr:hypothetical protein [Phycisphaeraceae bacterium]
MRVNPHERGSSMSEMILVLPFVLFILLLLIYFGRDLVRVQRTMVSARYESWRQVGRGPGPGGAGAEIDQMFLGGRAEDVGQSVPASFPDHADDALVEAAASDGVTTAQLVEQVRRDHPIGRVVRVRAEYEEGNRMWRRFSGPLRQTHARTDHEWRQANGWRTRSDNWRDSALEGRWPDGRPELRSAFAPNWLAWPEHGAWVPTRPSASSLHATRDVFFQPFSAGLESLQAGAAQPMAGLIHHLMAGNPRYFGPAVGFD